MTTPHFLTAAELDANPWATCGPASVAALLHRPLAEVRAAFPLQREGRTWTNARQLRGALDRLGLGWSERPFASDDTTTTTAHRIWPDRGLVLIQFVGPWTSYATELKHTHWIGVTPVTIGGVEERWIFDVNALRMNHGFLPFEVWETRVAPALVKDHPRRTGAWWVRESFALHPS